MVHDMDNVSPVNSPIGLDAVLPDTELVANRPVVFVMIDALIKPLAFVCRARATMRGEDGNLQADGQAEAALYVERQLIENGKALARGKEAP
ncbi:hypothetical protein D3C80_1663090 [compost metagenome]